MLILKSIAAYHGKNLQEILEMYPDCGGTARGFEIDYAWKKPEEQKKKRHRAGKKKGKKSEVQAQSEPDTSNMMEAGSENAALFLKYLASIQPKKTRKPPMLSGHTVTISLGYHLDNRRILKLEAELSLSLPLDEALLTREGQKRHHGYDKKLLHLDSLL